MKKTEFEVKPEENIDTVLKELEELISQEFINGEEVAKTNLQYKELALKEEKYRKAIQLVLSEIEKAEKVKEKFFACYEELKPLLDSLSSEIKDLFAYTSVDKFIVPKTLKEKRDRKFNTKEFSIFKSKYMAIKDGLSEHIKAIYSSQIQMIDSLILEIENILKKQTIFNKQNEKLIDCLTLLTKELQSLYSYNLASLSGNEQSKISESINKYSLSKISNDTVLKPHTNKLISFNLANFCHNNETSIENEKQLITTFLNENNETYNSLDMEYLKIARSLYKTGEKALKINKKFIKELQTNHFIEKLLLILMKYQIVANIDVLTEENLIELLEKFPGVYSEEIMDIIHGIYLKRLFYFKHQEVSNERSSNNNLTK